MQHLATIREESKPERRGYRWTPEEEDELRQLHADGLPTCEIATRLKRTLWSTASKLSELGLGSPSRNYRRRYGAIEPIARLVGRHFNVSMRALRGPRRFQEETWPRQIAMWLAAQIGCCQPHIGRYFRRDHTTAMHATRKVERLRLEDASVREMTDALLATVRENAPPPPPAVVPEPEPLPTNDPETPASEPPGAVEAMFYDGSSTCSGKTKNTRRFLEEQNERFAEAMRAAGEWA